MCDHLGFSTIYDHTHFKAFALVVQTCQDNKSKGKGSDAKFVLVVEINKKKPISKYVFLQYCHDDTMNFLGIELHIIIIDMIYTTYKD